MSTFDPDWGRRIAGAGGEVWLADGLPGVAFALPMDLDLRRDDGGPGLVLDAYLVDGDGATDAEGFGVASLRFVGRYDLMSRQAALLALLPGVRLQPLTLSSALVRYVASEAVGGLADMAFTPVEPGGTGFRLVQRLSANQLAAFRAMLRAGAVPIRAEAIITAIGKAVRAPGAAKVTGDALLGALGQQERLWSREALVAALAAGVAGLALPDGESAAEAAADRLLARHFRALPLLTEDEQPAFAVLAPTLAGRVFTLPLDESFFAPRSWLLRSSGLADVRLSEHALALTPDNMSVPVGLHVILVDANLPARRIGAPVLGAEVTFPAAPPDRPETLRRSVRFDSGEPQPIAVRLAADEPLRYTISTFVVMAAAGSGLRLTGPEIVNEDAQLTLRPQDFPIDFIRAEATPSLLAVGTVALAWRATTPHGAWSASATLTRAEPAIAVARPRDAADTQVTAELVATDGLSHLPLPIDDRRLLSLDLAAVPTAGPQSAAVTSAADAVIDVVGEDRKEEETAAVRVQLRANAPTALHWLALDPFRPGACLRRIETDGAPGLWSPPVAPGANVSLEALFAGIGPAMADTVPGDVELVALAPGRSQVRAVGPRLARGADGKPLVSLLRAGEMAFLQLTAEWTVDPERIATIAAALTPPGGNPPELALAPDQVRETALVTGSDGAEEVLASGTASGMPPQTSLLSATLDAAQAQVVERAMSGETGLVRLRYVVEAQDPVSAAAAAAIDNAAANHGHTATTIRAAPRTIISTCDLAEAVLAGT